MLLIPRRLLLMPPQHLLLMLQRRQPHISPPRLPILFLTLHRRPRAHTSPLLHLMLRRPLLPISPRQRPMLRLMRHCRPSPHISLRRLLRLHRRAHEISLLQGRVHMPRLELRTSPLQGRAPMPHLELRALRCLGRHLVQNHILQVQRRDDSSPFLTHLMWGGSPDRHRPQRPVRALTERLSTVMPARIRDLVLRTVTVRPSREV